MTATAQQMNDYRKAEFHRLSVERGRMDRRDTEKSFELTAQHFGVTVEAVRNAMLEG